jgi:hypothetical protein
LGPTLHNVVDFLVIVRVSSLDLHFGGMLLFLIVVSVVAGLISLDLLEQSILNLFVCVLKTLYVGFTLLRKHLGILECLFVVADG